MDLWQINAADDLKSFFKDYLNAEKVELHGSLLNHSSIDMYSDVDMRIFLRQKTAIDMTKLVKVLSAKVTNVFGYEIYESDNRDTLRIGFENGWRYDLTFIYPELKEPRPLNDSFEEKTNNIINQFWFMSLMVLVKLGRNDYLIASHLALELCQLNIIIQMLIRDSIKNTNLHRFGDKEDVPVLHSLTSITNNSDLQENDSALEILYILFCAAEQMDKMCTQLDSKYRSRKSILKELCYQYDIKCY